MIKKIVVFFSLLVSATLFAQENTASPYSYYGLGDVKFKGTHDIKAMGGLSIVGDSIHLNLSNPASYSNLKLTTFSIGGTSTFTNFNTSSDSEKAQRTSLDYLAVGLPLGKFGMSFGLMPYSAVGYKVQSITEAADDPDGFERSKQFMGDGEINKVFIGTAYKITQKLSLGFNLNYYFGDINNKTVEFITDPIVLLGTRELNNSNVSGFSINTGLQFSSKLNSNLELFSSLTYSPESELTSKNKRNIATVVYNANGAEIINDDVDIPVNDTKLKLPSKFSFGAGIGQAKKWLIGSEITFQNTSKLGNRFDDITGATFENSTKISIGGYYIPKYDSYNGYWNRVVYRAGFRHENTGLVINNESIKDYGVNFGFGLPLGISNINLGFEFGKKGTTTNNLIEENYFNVSVGLSLNDIWFKKRKID